MSDLIPREAFPPISEALIKALEQRFPNQCPNLTTSEREVWSQVGAAGVVTFLKSVFKDQKMTLQVQTKRSP